MLAAETRSSYAVLHGGHDVDQLPLVELAEELFGLTAFDDPSMPGAVAGEINLVVRSIRLQPGMPHTRRRFVIAHEIGHAVLAGMPARSWQDLAVTIDEQGTLGDEPDVRGYHTQSRDEQEANRFARELLIPAARLWNLVQQPGWTIESLAELFGVSIDALLSQLINICGQEPAWLSPRRAMVSSVRETLSVEQRQAVSVRSPALVVAGPGTGKTHCVVARYCYLVDQGAPPDTILVLAFGNRAAGELYERIRHALGSRYPEAVAQVEIATFHGWGLRMLRIFGHRCELPSDARLADRGVLYALLRQRLDELPLVDLARTGETARYLPALLRTILRAKDEGLSSDDFNTEAEAIAVHLAGAVPDSERHVARLREVAAAYRCYDALLREERLLDYGDLLLKPVQLLKNADVARSLHGQYQHILVDELQDLNRANLELIQLLDGGRGRLWAVGDPRQSIYDFRGAVPAIMDQLLGQYPGLRVLSLSGSQRSPQAILDAAHAVLGTDRDPRLVAVRPTRRIGRAVVEMVAPDERVEVAALARDIRRRVIQAGSRAAGSALTARVRHSHRRGVLRLLRRWRWADHVVLYRSRRQGARLAAALEALGLPVELVGDISEAPEVREALRRCHPSDEQEGELIGSSPAGAGDTDAYHALAMCLFDHDQGMRERLRKAGHGQWQARRELLRLGQLLLAARGFTDETLPGQRGMSAFREHLQRLRESGEPIGQLQRAAQADVVRVMSIHAAKGLEFPFVYLPALEEGQFIARPRAEEIPSLPRLMPEAGTEVEQARRLLYVGMTRAQERLVLTRALQRYGRGARRLSLLPGDEDGHGAPWPVVSLLSRPIRVEPLK